MLEEQSQPATRNLVVSDELKLKSLEARLIGPSKDGLPPITSNADVLDIEQIRSSKFLVLPLF